MSVPKAYAAFEGETCARRIFGNLEAIHLIVQ
jgi:hypothetical protein